MPDWLKGGIWGASATAVDTAYLLGIVKVRALEEAFNSAGLALASTEMGVKAGTRNNLDVVNARQQVFSAQRDLSKGRYDYVIARLRLKSAAGTLGEGDIELVNRWLTAAQ